LEELEKPFEPLCVRNTGFPVVLDIVEPVAVWFGKADPDRGVEKSAEVNVEKTEIGVEVQ